MSESHSRAMNAFRMHSANHHEAGGGGHTGAGSVFDFFNGTGEMRITEPFGRSLSNMMQALGYFESSLGLQTALGHQSFTPPAVGSGKVPGLISKGR